MANDPFDPPIVKIQRTLQRGGLAGANRGAGSVRGLPTSVRSAPGPQELTELNDVDGSVTPVDGDTLVYDAALELWVPGTSSGPSSSIKDRRWALGPGQTTIDEFEEEAVDGAWVRVDSAGEASHLTYTESGGVLSMLHTGTDSTSEMHGLVQPIGSFGIGDTLETAILGPWGVGQDYPMCGLVLADGTTPGAGTQVICTVWYSSGFRSIGIRHETNWNVDAGGSVDQIVGPSTWGAWMYLRLTWDAVNSFTWAWSMDGVSWITYGAFAVTMTPTHLGLMFSSWGASNTIGASVEYVRKQ